MALPEPPRSLERPELFIGLVAATGTDFSYVGSRLADALKVVGYQSETIHVIELLTVFKPWASLTQTPLEDQIRSKMDAGDRFCEWLQDSSALARLALGKIRSLREAVGGEPTRPAANTAFILRSLKRVDEVNFLRRLYGPNFFLIGAFAPRENRVNDLASRIARSHHLASSDQYRKDAEELIYRDFDDQGRPSGQHVGDTFPMADFFVDASEPGRLRDGMNRFVELLFGHPYKTPTRDEYGMFLAEAAALRSAALSRQVGCSIATSEGSVVAVGTNEVPKTGGGHYWEDDPRDARDHQKGGDVSDLIRRAMIAEVIDRLKKAGWLDKTKSETAVEDLVKEALDSPDHPVLKGTQVMRVIEYARQVHAEMSALTDAALRGVSVRNCILYTTTYPCHNCARHIIAAGIKKVVYREPYPKSLSSELHRDAMAHDTETDERVGFCAFMGLAPRRYVQFFEMPLRKDKRGQLIRWDPVTAIPRGVPDSPEYLTAAESLELDEFGAAVNRVPELLN